MSCLWFQGECVKKDINGLMWFFALSGSQYYNTMHSCSNNIQKRREKCLLLFSPLINNTGKSFERPGWFASSQKPTHVTSSSFIPGCFSGLRVILHSPPQGESRPWSIRHVGSLPAFTASEPCLGADRCLIKNPPRGSNCTWGEGPANDPSPAEITALS